MDFDRRNTQIKIQALRKIFAKAPPINGIRLGLRSVGGTWIDDAYIYRIKR